MKNYKLIPLGVRISFSEQKENEQLTSINNKLNLNHGKEQII